MHTLNQSIAIKASHLSPRFIWSTLYVWSDLGLLYVFGLIRSYALRSLGRQWVERWPTDIADRVRIKCYQTGLVVRSSSPARGEIFFIVNGVIAHSLSLLSKHGPEITEILLKMT